MRRRGNELREHLVQTATELFYSEGFRASGVDRIAAAAGVTKRSLYHHFPTKDDLIAEVLRRRHIAWVSSIRGELPRRASDPAGQLVAWFDMLDESLRSPKYRGCIFFNASIEFPEPPAPIRAILDENTLAGHNLLVELARGAGVASAEALAVELGIIRRGAQMSVTVTRDKSLGLAAKSAALRILAQFGVEVSTTNGARRPRSVHA